LALVAEAFGGLGAEDHWDADVAEAFGEVDGLVGAALDGGELVQDQQHVIAHSGLAAGGEVPEVFQDQADGGVGVLAAGDGGDGEHGQVDVLEPPKAVGLASQGAEEGRVAATDPGQHLGVGGELLQVLPGRLIVAPEGLQFFEVEAAQEVVAGSGWAAGVQSGWPCGVQSSRSREREAVWRRCGGSCQGTGRRLDAAMVARPQGSIGTI